jgi:hypothetical protein
MKTETIWIGKKEVLPWSSLITILIAICTIVLNSKESVQQPIIIICSILFFGIVFMYIIDKRNKNKKNSELIIFIVCVMIVASFIMMNFISNGYVINKLSDQNSNNGNIPVNEGSNFNFSATDTTFICTANPDISHGNHTKYPYILVRNQEGLSDNIYEIDGLIKFDISSIPSNSEIISAKLKCYYFKWEDNDPRGRSLNIYRITTDWNEIDAIWNNQPSIASLPSNSAIVPFSSGWISWDVTSDLKLFINGQENNYGWKLCDETPWGRPNIPQIYFYPKDYSSKSPYLEIVYV